MSEYYWILNLDSNVTDNKFSLTISAPDQRLPNWRETKVVFLLKDNELVAICRVARLRKTLSTTEVLLDRRIEASASWNEDWQKSQLDLRPSSILYAVSDDLTAAQFVARCLPQPLESLPPFAGTPDRQIQTYIRRLAVLAFEDDELGPADGPRETIEGVSVRDRYLVGRLPPRIPSL